MEPKEKTMPDFRLSLLDADEHLDIKINRFGVSTTHLLYHVESMSYIGGGGLYLMAQDLEPKFRVPAMCKKSDRSFSITQLSIIWTASVNFYNKI